MKLALTFRKFTAEYTKGGHMTLILGSSTDLSGGSALKWGAVRGRS